MLTLRKKLIWAYAWAVPSREAVEAVSRLSPLIELGAGTGYWAWLISQAGADLLAFDRNASAPPHWFEMGVGGPEQLARNPERTLFLCWPPLDEALAEDCLREYRGEKLALIGESGADARTGSSAFRKALAEGFEVSQEITVPCWPGFSDSLRIYRRVS